MKNVIISLSESYHVTVKTSNITDAGTKRKSVYQKFMAIRA